MRVEIINFCYVSISIERFRSLNFYLFVLGNSFFLRFDFKVFFFFNLPINFLLKRSVLFEYENLRDKVEVEQMMDVQWLVVPNSRPLW